MKLTVTIPGMRLRSPNAMRGTTRGARMALSRETRSKRMAARLAMRCCFVNSVSFSHTITLTRIAPRAFDDDNLAASFKAVRDGVADALGVKDNDPRVTWRYAQRRGKAREYAVLIEIEPRADDYPASVPAMVEDAL